MGKSQKKKLMRRHNPMRVPDSHIPKGLASASSSSSKTEEILPIIQKMESLDASERKWACVAVSNLIQNDPSTRRLLQGKNVVGALINRLTDSEEEVVIEAAGALRNLCVDGGYDICAEMYNKNILTPLTTFIPKISTTLSQFLESPHTAPENAQQLVFELADNVITTLWCLSETSNKALNAINQINLIPFLMSFLSSRGKLPLTTVTSAAQCLYVLTDDNLPAIQEVRTNAGYISCLLSVVRPEDVSTNGKGKEVSNERLVTLSVLASGVLRNVIPIPPPSAASFVNIDQEIVLPLLEPVISSISLLEAAQNVQELIKQETSEPQIAKLSLKNTPGSDHKTSSESELDRIENKLRTVQLALEILTGACATLPDPAPLEEAEVDGVDEDDEADINAADDDADADMAVDGTNTKNGTTSFLPNLVQPLLRLVHPTPLSFPPLQGGSPHPPTTSALSAIHIGALECLNNIFLSLTASPNLAIASDVQSGRQVWDEVWLALSAVGTQAGLGQERRQEIWEIAVGVLWGIGNTWKGSLIPKEEQIQVLIQLCNSTTDSSIRVKCIGTLECLAQHPDSIDANRVIATFLLSLLPTSTTPSATDVEPLIQAASALIDIYSDENLPYDINFRQGAFSARLAASVDGVKKAVKAIDRRKEGGRVLKRRGEEVKENLVAFIQYRNDLSL